MTTWKEEAKDLTFRALPIYFLLPVLTFLCNQASLFSDSTPLLNFVVYFWTVELFTFLDHYYFLHKKKHFRHDVHHKFKADIDWHVSFAFFPLDGLSQGFPILICALVCRVSASCVYCMIFFVGIWTLFIHTDTGVRIPFFLDFRYHQIHHTKNWHNFGLFTQTFDNVFGTLKHP